MKYYDEFAKLNPNLARYKASLETYEREAKVDMDSMDESLFMEFSKWLMNNYSTAASYQRRSAAKKYIEYIYQMQGKEMFFASKMNYAKNSYDDSVYDKVSCQYLFYDQMMVYINKKIGDYIDYKIEPGQPTEWIRDGFVYQQAIYTLIWNGYHPNYIPSIKMSSLDFEKHTIDGRYISKGWEYVEMLSKQKSFYAMRGKGKAVERMYYGNVYLFRHRTEVESQKRYEPVTRDELRSVMTYFLNNVLDGDFALPVEIMYNGAISNFFKTDSAHNTPVVVMDELKNFAQDYCIGYSELPSKKVLYDHFELYKKNLLKYLMEKYNVTDLL